MKKLYDHLRRCLNGSHLKKRNLSMSLCTKIKNLINVFQLSQSNKIIFCVLIVTWKEIFREQVKHLLWLNLIVNVLCKNHKKVDGSIKNTYFKRMLKWACRFEFMHFSWLVDTKVTFQNGLRCTVYINGQILWQYFQLLSGSQFCTELKGQNPGRRDKINSKICIKNNLSEAL